MLRALEALSLRLGEAVSLPHDNGGYWGLCPTGSFPRLAAGRLTKREPQIALTVS